jgi:hypothetical protein
VCLHGKTPPPSSHISTCNHSHAAPSHSSHVGACPRLPLPASPAPWGCWVRREAGSSPYIYTHEQYPRALATNSCTYMTAAAAAAGRVSMAADATVPTSRLGGHSGPRFALCMCAWVWMWVWRPPLPPPPTSGQPHTSQPHHPFLRWRDRQPPLGQPHAAEKLLWMCAP